VGRGPGAHQDRNAEAGEEMIEELFADAPPLPGRIHVSVADEGHFPQVLAAHNPHQTAFTFIAPEIDPGPEFILQFLRAHIRFMPAIRRDDPAVSLGRGVDDGQDDFSFVGAQGTNHFFTSGASYAPILPLRAWVFPIFGA